MSVDTMARLYELKNIVGVKDATANVARVSLQRQAMGPDFIQLSGEDATALGFMAAWRPRLHLGDVERRAAPVQRDAGGLPRRRLTRRRSRCRTGSCRSTRRSSSRPIRRRRKYALSVLGRMADEVRLPLMPVSEATKAHDPLRHGPCGAAERVSMSRAITRPARTVVADNRKARFNYEILETYEAGIALTGTEVKSLRGGKATIGEAYAGPSGEELFLFNAYIPEYLQANRFNHETRRPRRLLLHKRQINKLIGATQREGFTVIPLKIYFNDRGRAKVELGLGRGKKLHDKRETEKERTWNREKARLMRDKG